MNDSKVIAALYRCDGCHSWWSSREVDVPEAHLIFQMAEGHKSLFPWEDYKGWQAGAEAAVCSQCGKKAAGPKFSLTQSGDLC